MAKVSTFLIAVALVVGMVGCDGPFDLTITSTVGGNVTTPGEDTFTYDEGMVVNLTAEAEEGYSFVEWTGDVGTIADVNDATTTITMNADYIITANFNELLEQQYIILGAPLSIGYPDGICARDNLELAVEEINDAGGFDVGGVNYQFKLESLDTRDLEPGVPVSESLLAVEKLILDKDADFIVGGPLRSEVALAAMDLAYQYQTVFLWSAGFLSPAMDSKVAGDYDTYKYCFRTQGSLISLVNESVSILEQIRADQGWTSPKAYIMVQNVANGAAVGNVISSALTGAGWNITGHEHFPPGTTDFSTELLECAGTGAEVLYAWFDMPESANLVEQAYDMQLPALIAGFIYPCHDSLAWNSSGGKCEYVVNYFPRAGIAPSTALPAVAPYITLHTAEKGYPPGLTWVAPVSYQAPYVLKDAIERAGTYTNADAVIAALQATNITKADSVFGRITFDANNQCVYAGDQDPDTGAVTTWTQWVSPGSLVAVYPTLVATDTVQLPSWMP